MNRDIYSSPASAAGRAGTNGDIPTVSPYHDSARETSPQDYLEVARGQVANLYEFVVANPILLGSVAFAAAGALAGSRLAAAMERRSRARAYQKAIVSAKTSLLGGLLRGSRVAMTGAETGKRGMLSVAQLVSEKMPEKLPSGRDTSKKAVRAATELRAAIDLVPVFAALISNPLVRRVGMGTLVRQLRKRARSRSR